MTSPNSTLRVALVGYGHAGAVFHAPLIATTPGLRLAAIVTSDRERAERAAHRYPAALILPSADEVWGAADRYDLAVIAAPNRVHVSLGLAALRAGLPVVIDKPLAPTVADACALIAAARSANRQLTVFHNARWSIPFLTIRRIIDSGVLGPIASYEARMERYRPSPRPGAWRERGAPEEAGGLLYDLGSHLIDQALLLFGRVTDVYAELEHRRPGTEVDDDSFVALRFAGGIRAHLWMSYVARLPGPAVRVAGLNGTFIKADPDPQESALQSGMRPCDSNWGIEAREHWGRLVARVNGLEVDGLVESARGAYDQFYAQLRDALLGGGPLPVDPEDALRGLEVIGAAQASAREHRVVTMRGPTPQ
jgi:predicted dehydrogenase